MSILHTIANQQQSRDAQIKAWMKPRIKLQDDLWVCTGRGTTVTSYCPRAAYILWIFAIQPNVIYAQSLVEVTL